MVMYCCLTKVFKHGFWLAGGCAASQSEAKFENPVQLKQILTCGFLHKKDWWNHYKISVSQSREDMIIDNCKKGISGRSQATTTTAVGIIGYRQADNGGHIDYLTLNVLNFSEGTKTSIHILYQSSTLTWQRLLESFLLKDQDFPILHSH